MKNIWVPVAALLFAGLVIGGTIWWRLYVYHDCRHVGHSILYCVAAQR